MKRLGSWDSRLMEALGRGLVAGLLGTAAMTTSSTAEAKLSGGPAQLRRRLRPMVGVVPRIRPVRIASTTLAHWWYGTAWGTFRSACDVAVLGGPMATLLHRVAVWGAEQRYCRVRLPVRCKGLADGRE